MQGREVPGAVSEIEAGDVPNEVVNGKHRQYLANILSQKFALNGSYGIYLFMGDFDGNPATWATSPNLIGTHAVFAGLSTVDAASSPQAQSLRSKPAIQVTGTMPLTSMLLAKAQSGELADMAPQTVETYLTDNLHWRIGMFNGNQIPLEDVADLSVTVITAQVNPASSADEFPQWYNFRELTRITHGKLGGC